MIQNPICGCSKYNSAACFQIAGSHMKVFVCGANLVYQWFVVPLPKQTDSKCWKLEHAKEVLVADLKFQMQTWFFCCSKFNLMKSHDYRSFMEFRRNELVAELVLSLLKILQIQIEWTKCDHDVKFRATFKGPAVMPLSNFHCGNQNQPQDVIQVKYQTWTKMWFNAKLLVAKRILICILKH